MKKIVFLDDSQTILFMAEESISEKVKQGLVEGIYYSNPLDFLKDYKEGLVVDLLITDINMPEISGYEVTRKLRDSGFKNPIVALTTESSTEQKNKAKEAGMNAWLVKPFDDKKITNILEKIFKI
jgi:two-component system chemotaxis response regulator CheY